jgi:hypothetical protein
MVSDKGGDKTVSEQPVQRMAVRRPLNRNVGIVLDIIPINSCNPEGLVREFYIKQIRNFLGETNNFILKIRLGYAPHVLHA